MRPLAVVLLLALACGRTGDYTGVGDVLAIDRAASEVTIRHEDIPGLMGAMTMRFPVAAPDVLAAAVPGTRVRFGLAQQGTRLVVTRLVRLGAAGAGTPGVHDHTPHHGGVVAMVGMLHLEAVASPAGTIAVYLSDVWRRPLPVGDVQGSVTVGVGDGKRELPLVPRADALEASGPPLAGHDVPAHVRLTRAGESIEEHFVLALRDGAAGAAEAPLDGCVSPPPDSERGARRPRCTLAFHQPVSVIAAVPDGSLVLVAVVNGGVAAWAMPDARFQLGFAAPPPIPTPVDAPPHPDTVGVVAVGPDGRETALTVENRLLVHVTASGALARELPAFSGLIRGVAWSGDGRRLLVTLFYDANAHLLAADDGHELARIPIEREGAAVAFSPDGRTAAVGSEVGPIVLADVAGARPPVVLADGQRPVTALAFAGDRLVSGAGDGVVRVWRDGAVVARAATAPGLLRLALAPGGRLFASAGLDHVVRLHDVDTGDVVETLAWHRAAIWGLAWAGATLVSGDATGQVALWDLADRVRP